jgi:hypothetical protein
VAVALKVIVSGNLVYNLFMSDALQMMWGEISILQLLLHIPLLNLVLPPNSAILCGVLIEVTSFDWFDAEKMTDWVFGADSFTPNTLEPQSTRL